MIENPHYSVELLHVYSDEAFNAEHKEGAKTANELLRKLPQNNIATILLIDNYNPAEKDFDTDAFISQAAHHGTPIDQIAFEADLVPYCSEMLDLIDDNKFRKRYEKYIASRKKIPCSFLTATWYLLRLGALTPHDKIIISQNNKVFLPAQKLINVLPDRFRPTEDKAMTIIKHTRHRAVLDKIKTLYYTSPNTHHPSL